MDGACRITQPNTHDPGRKADGCKVSSIGNWRRSNSLTMIYKNYFPLIRQSNPPRKGIGKTGGTMYDLQTLGVTWFYDWGSHKYNDMRYVPMSKFGEDPATA